MRSRLRALRKRIDEIERSSKPSQPVKPNTQGGTYEQQLLWGKRHVEDLRNYEAAIVDYRADREKLPALRAEADGVARDAAEMTSRIAQQIAQNDIAAQGFEANVVAACDKDLLLELNDTMGRASAAFQTGGDPFRGFWTLLGATRLAKLFKGIAQPAVASEINASVVRESEALAAPIKEHLAEIAKSALLGPAIIDRALKANRATLDDLMTKLNALPVTGFVDGCERARTLVADQLPETPFAFAAAIPSI
jgi:hypothetical protein